MPFLYDKLWKLLIDRKMKKTDLLAEVGITPTTLSKLSKNQNVSMLTIDKLCSYFSCPIEDIVEHQQFLPDKEQQLGTFRPNHSQAIHRWYPYLEGYSKQMVEKELERFPDIKSVLDPFAGSGTTMLVSSLMSIDTYFAEINPVLSFVSNTKVNTVINILQENKISALSNTISDVLEELSNSSYNDKIQFGGFEKYFSDKNLSEIVNYKNIVNQVEDVDLRDILLLALISVAVPASKMVRRGDLRFARPNEKSDQDFFTLVKNKLYDICEDIVSAKNSNMKPTIKLADDVRSINQSNLVDAVITSPPYLNGTNYSRNTKLELKLLDFITSEEDLSTFHRQGIVAGINNVSLATTNNNILKEVQPYYDALIPVAYDKRIPKMISNYFYDMNHAIRQLAKAIRKGGYLIIDIGDSQFAGIHIPTHELLTKLAENNGFFALDETVIRKRKSKNGYQLTQRIIRFRRG